MNYEVSILRRAQRELSELPAVDYERVRDVIRGLSEEPRPPGCVKLTGHDGWRIRVGRYRVIYDVEDAQNTVVVLNLGHRRDIYR